MENNNNQPTVEGIEAKAQQIREDIAKAKATGVQEGSAEAKRIEDEVREIKSEAGRLSPEAFSDLQQHEHKVEIVE